MPLATSESKVHWFAVAFCFDVYFSAEATLATPQSRHFWLPPFARLCMLVSANYGTIYKVYFPINFSTSISLLSQVFPNLLPASYPPAIESTVDGTVLAITLGKIPPSSSRAMPPYAVNSAPMLCPWLSCPSFLRR